MKVSVRTPDNGDPCLSEWEDIEGEKVEVTIDLRGGGQLHLTEVDDQSVRIVLANRPNIHLQTW